MLEIRTVGRKTPKDGKLEITEATARRLAIIGAEIPVRVSAQVSTAVLLGLVSFLRRAGRHAVVFSKSALASAVV